MYIVNWTKNKHENSIILAPVEYTIEIYESVFEASRHHIRYIIELSVKFSVLSVLSTCFFGFTYIGYFVGYEKRYKWTTFTTTLHVYSCKLLVFIGPVICWIFYLSGACDDQI